MRLTLHAALALGLEIVLAQLVFESSDNCMTALPTFATVYPKWKAIRAA
jgi:hypothetical protein